MRPPPALPELYRLSALRSSPVAEFVLDVTNRRLENQSGPIELVPKSFDVLVHLVRTANNLVTREEFHQKVWHGVATTDSVLNGCIHELRKALGDNPSDSLYIQTHAKHGYSFIGRVERVGAEALPASRTLTQAHTENDRNDRLGSYATLVEDGVYLQDRWAALNAVAATDALFHPAFFEILRQLTVVEAKLLDAIYDKALQAQLAFPFAELNTLSVAASTIGAIDDVFMLFNDTRLTTTPWSQEDIEKYVFRGAPEGCEQDWQRFGDCLDSLLRIGLVKEISPDTQASEDKAYNEILETMESETGLPLPRHVTYRHAKRYNHLYRLTSTGYRFVRATRGPSDSSVDISREDDGK
jgi:DNA-binding winged helix-turn-helix (wHTH) protein